MSAVRDAIVLALQADATITPLVSAVYPAMPPEGATFPLITVTATQPPRANRVFQRVGFEDSIYLVRAVDRSTSPALADDINTAIRTALDGVALTITGFTSRGIFWTQDYETHEVYDGQIYQYAGGFYEVMAE